MADEKKNFIGGMYPKENHLKDFIKCQISIKTKKNLLSGFKTTDKDEEWINI
jgi:hypothetical protein